jgi:hypothetical protein
MAQQKERFGPIAAAPILGPSAGSVEASTDPFSPQSIAKMALTQQIQATADTRYDPDVPAPIVQAFADMINSSSPTQTHNIAVGTALLLISAVLIHACLT